MSLWGMNPSLFSKSGRFIPQTNFALWCESQNGTGQSFGSMSTLRSFLLLPEPRKRQNERSCCTSEVRDPVLPLISSLSESGKLRKSPRCTLGPGFDGLKVSWYKPHPFGGGQRECAKNSKHVSSQQKFSWHIT